MTTSTTIIMFPHLLLDEAVSFLCFWWEKVILCVLTGVEYVEDLKMHLRFKKMRDL